MERTAEVGMQRFLGYKIVTLPPRPYPHDCTKWLTYFPGVTHTHLQPCSVACCILPLARQMLRKPPPSPHCPHRDGGVDTEGTDWSVTDMLRV
jgi:hypothetical protein